MKNKISYSHIIWDWNGTLLDDVNWCLEVINCLISKRGIKRLDNIFDVLYKRYIERDNVEKRHWVHKSAGDTKEIFVDMHKKNDMGEKGIGKILEIDATHFENIDYDKFINVTKEFILE